MKHFLTLTMNLKINDNPELINKGIRSITAMIAHCNPFQIASTETERVL